MSPTQKRLFLALSIAIALTRGLAVAHSLFDWDEALFASAVRDYDVAEHQPHPPGYPLFVGAAKLVHLLGVEEFRSLQVIVVLSAAFLFPALFFLARALEFDFATSASGAAIFVFLPNVWVHGGTGYSDVPSTAIGFAACALLLFGRRDSRAYILGAVVLGIAAGIRPTWLLTGAIPALLATWDRVRARAFGAVAAAIVLGAAVVAVSYAGAALASTSVDAFVDAVRTQGEYVRAIDSYRNPVRGNLRHAARLFLVWPVDSPILMTTLAAFAALSAGAAILRRRAAPLLTILMFAPVALLSWIDLDINAASRYAIAYMAVHALLCADGFRVVGRKVAVQAALATALVAAFMVWTWPALRLQRAEDSPPAAALHWIRQNVPPGSTVLVGGGFMPHARFLLADYQLSWFDSPEEISSLAGEAWVVDWRVMEGGVDFIWPHGALWSTIRQRNFESSVKRAAAMLRFGAGWYSQEGEGEAMFRWMGKESHTTLPSFSGNGTLSMRIYVPVDTIQPPPSVDVFLNGQLIERFTSAEAYVSRSWTLPSRQDAPNELVITTSTTVNPSNVSDSEDTRELGLRIDRLSWLPLR